MDKSLEAYARDLKESIDVLSACDKRTSQKIVDYLVDNVKNKTSSFQHKLKREREDN